jgi:hypothetical protein
MTRTILLAAVAAIALVAAGCGSSSSPRATSATGAPDASPSGDIPDNQAYVRYAPRGTAYSVEVPEGWSRTAAGGATVFTDKLNAIRVESRPARRALTVAAARATEVPRLRAAVKGFRPGTVTTVSRRAGSAVRIAYLATARPNEVTGKAGVDAVERYVFFHGGRQVVLTLSGPRGADNVDPWRIVTDSLRWTG